MPLDIASGGEVVGIVIGAGGKGAEGVTDQPFIFVRWFPAVISDLYNFCEYTHS